MAEAHLIQPTFITEYPAEVSPLARRNDVNPEITDRFEFFIGGREIGNGFSELNDAEDASAALPDQVNAKAAGDDEAMFYDEDYVTALEYGLPPTAGLGIGIDRMVMLFTNSHTIRDVILSRPCVRRSNPLHSLPACAGRFSCIIPGLSAERCYYRTFCNVPRWLPFAHTPLKASFSVKAELFTRKVSLPGWLSPPQPDGRGFSQF